MRAILFDLDGTLWDSSTAVAESWVESLKNTDYPGYLTAEKMQGYMGWPMDAIADDVFSMYPPQERKKWADYCEKKENDYVAVHGGKLFEHLEDVLRELKEEGYFLGLVSNCQDGYIEAFFQYSGLGKYFDDYESFGRTGLYKADNILLVIERNRLDDTLYVGDIQMDYEACKEADVPFVHARYGFGKTDAKYGIDSLSDLPKISHAVFETETREQMDKESADQDMMKSVMNKETFDDQANEHDDLIIEPFDPNGPYRSAIEALYHTSFPDYERKPFAMIEDGLKAGKMELYAALLNGQPIALTFIILGEPFDVLDYLAVDPKAHSKGIGSKILEWMQSVRKRPFLVEIESTLQNPSDDMIRRKAFYLRSKMIDAHEQIELFDTPMELMSWPDPVSFEQYHQIMTNYFGKELARRVKHIARSAFD